MIRLLGALLVICMVCQPVGVVYAEPIVLSDIEEAKSDLLFLDRQLSQLEAKLLFPMRTTVLFGLSAKSTKAVSSLQLSFNGKPTTRRSLSAIDLLSLQKGAMVTLFDANLPRGVYDLQLNYTLSDGGEMQQKFKLNKTIDKQIIGLKLLDNPPPRSPPVRLTIWSGADE